MSCDFQGVTCIGDIDNHEDFSNPQTDSQMLLGILLGIWKEPVLVVDICGENKSGTGRAGSNEESV